MSSEHKKIALERIDEAFKNPTWYNIDDIKYLSMLDITKEEFMELSDHIHERLTKYMTIEHEISNLLRRSVNTK
jgi:hypothetical protein